MYQNTNSMKNINNFINSLVTKHYFKSKLDVQIYIVLVSGLIVGSIANFL